MGKIFKYLGPIIIYVVIYLDISRSQKKVSKIFIPLIGLGLIVSLVMGIYDLRGKLSQDLEYYGKVLNILVFLAYLVVSRFKFKKD